MADLAKLLRGGAMMMLVATLSAVVPVHSEDLAARRTRAFALFEAAINADAAAIAQGRAELEAILAQNPEDALARAHRGWLRVLEAREMPLRDARASAVRGFAEMDEAVRLSPEDPHIRLIRAQCAYQAPRLLGRHEQAQADFAWLVQGALRTVGSEQWPASLRREILLHAGSFALKERRARDAVELLEQALALPAESPPETEIQSMLALARRELSSHSHGESPHPREAPSAAP